MIIIRYIGVYFSKPIWSFIRNCVFWLFHLGKIGAVKKEMEAIKGLKIETLMNLFKWQEDVVGDWTPWVSTVIAKDLQDDCDGAAPLVHTLANRINDGTNLKLVVTPAAEATMTIEFIVRGVILE